MLNRFFLILVILTLSTFSGCRLAPVPQSVSLPNQNLEQALEGAELKQLIIFNDSNVIMFGLDGTARINVFVDGQSVGQLNRKEYMISSVKKGAHTIDLVHRDMVHFESTHEINTDGDITYLKICAKTTSNGVEVVAKPSEFESKYRPAYKVRK